jgi:CubicO group peptidase (beta-lactamase class C family)
MARMKESQIETGARQILSRRPAVGLALGVVRNGDLHSFYGHGVANVATKAPITQDTIFRVASITKTFTAIAVMQLWEQGLVELDAPASEYLRAYRLIPAKASFTPATLRHLLTHTAGLPEVVHPSGVLRPDFGESVPAGRPLPTLAEFYAPGLRIEAEPGTRFIYTNHGPATLGQIVEDVTGQPLGRYLHEHVFEPLGMADTSLTRSDLDPARLATGYRLRSGGPTPVRHREMVTAGAASAYSTPRDMARYVAALLGGGTNSHGFVLKPGSLAAMFEPQYQPDPRMPGMGLAFFRGYTGGHPLVEHQGILPGFNSQIFAALEDGTGVIAFTNGARQAMFWLPAETGSLLAHLIGTHDEAIRTNVPQHPQIWGEVCGWYQLAAGLTDARARGMLGAGAEVFVRRGQLMLRCLAPVPEMYRGFPLHPDDGEDPCVFRMDLSEAGLGTMRVVFSRGAGGDVTGLHLEAMPLTLKKRAGAANPRVWAQGLAVAATAATGRYLTARRRRSAS